MNKTLVIILGASACVITAAAAGVALYLKKKRTTRKNDSPEKEEVTTEEEQPAENCKNVLDDSLKTDNHISMDEKRYVNYSSVASDKVSTVDGNQYKKLVDSILKDAKAKDESFGIIKDAMPNFDITEERTENIRPKKVKKNKRPKDGYDLLNVSLIELISEDEYDSDSSTNDIMGLTYFRGNNRLVNSEFEIVDNPKELLGKYYKTLSEYDEDFAYFRNHILGLDIEIAFEDDEYVSEYDFEYDEDVM